MKKNPNLVLSVLSAMMLSGCTISFQIIDTHGSASDVVDDTASNAPTVSPNLNIPVTGVPKLPLGGKTA